MDELCIFSQYPQVDIKELNRIVKGCKAGRREAQQSLFNLFSEELFGVCLYYSADRAEAEDNLHEGFIKIFSKIGQYRFKGPIQGWMRRIMINTALEKYRKKSHLHVVGDEFDFDRGLAPDNIADDISAKDLIAIIQELSPKYRMVFNLYAIEGYSHKEISEMLGISEGTSKSNLARARAVLQKRVKKYYFGKSANNS